MVFTPGAIWGALQDLPPSAVARNGVPPIRDWNPFRTGNPPSSYTRRRTRFLLHRWRRPSQHPCRFRRKSSNTKERAARWGPRRARIRQPAPEQWRRISRYCKYPLSTLLHFSSYCVCSCGSIRRFSFSLAEREGVSNAGGSRGGRSLRLGCVVVAAGFANDVGHHFGGTGGLELGGHAAQGDTEHIAVMQFRSGVPGAGMLPG